MPNNEQSVKEVRAAVEKWAQALHAQDLEKMHQHHASNYRLFDVQATVSGIEASKALWKQCMPYFDKPTIEYKDMQIEASDDMAVVHFKSRMKGMVMELPPEMANAWIRGTCCFRKTDDVWQCFHEHISFPVDCEKNAIAYDVAAA